MEAAGGFYRKVLVFEREDPGCGKSSKKRGVYQNSGFLSETSG